MKISFILTALLFCMSARSQNNSIGIGETFKNYANVSLAQGNGTMVSLKPIEETSGSPYLINGWATGSIHMNNGTTLNEPTTSLNYDKIKGKILVNLSENKVFEINMNNIDFFTLQTDSTSWKFSRISQIPSEFSVNIYTDSLYSLYKAIDTKFYQSDYENKGMYEKGYKYDRYVDNQNYYIVSKSGKTYNLHKGTKRDLKNLSSEIPAIKKFMSLNNDSLDGESYLIQAVTFMNR